MNYELPYSLSLVWQTIVRSKVNGEEQEYMEIIMRNARRLQRLTQNILDVTKIENHSLNLDRESFDLNDTDIIN